MPTRKWVQSQATISLGTEKAGSQPAPETGFENATLKVSNDTTVELIFDSSYLAPHHVVASLRLIKYNCAKVFTG